MKTLTNESIIKSINYNQHEIIKNIISLHTGNIDCDVTYSKGQFYKDSGIQEPILKFDLFPQTEDTIKANANNIPLPANSVINLMFDPPFIVGHTSRNPTGIIGERFHGFRYIKDLWGWYYECLVEFTRVLSIGSHLIVKCQDVISSGRQYLSHVYLINEAEKLGFYTKDIFVLNAKNRIIGHNHHNQRHARKFHSYFIVFEMGKKKVSDCSLTKS